MKRNFFNKNKKLRKNFSQTAKIFVLLLLLVFYVFQVTEMTKDIHTIQAYNRKIVNIYEESRRVEYGFLKSNSVSRTEEFVEAGNFVGISNIYYVNLPDPEIALK